MDKRISFAYIWHGFFLGLTTSMLDLNTVFPALVTELTGSRVVFGLLYGVMLGAPLVFNLLFSHHLRSKPYKKGYLLAGIWLRALSFFGMSVTTFLLGKEHPSLAIASFFIWVFLFSVSAGFAGISYADLLGKTMMGPARVRLYAAKQFAGSTASFGGGLLVSFLFRSGGPGFPYNYGINLAVGFVGLGIATAGFYRIREPASPPPARGPETLSAYLRGVPALLRQDARFRRFLLVENLTSFSVMALPFYMVFARERFGLDTKYIGQYLLVQVAGTILSNLVWGRIARRSSPKAIVRTCILLGAMIPVAALLLARTNPVWYAVLFFFIGFIISGRRIGFEPYLLDIAPEESRTEYLGIRGTLNVLIVLLPVIGGLLIGRFGYTPVFLLVSASMVTSVLLMGGDRQDGLEHRGEPFTEKADS